MRILQRKSYRPLLQVAPGDHLELTYTYPTPRPWWNPFGKPGVRTEVLINQEIEESMTIDAAVAFLVEPGDFEGAKAGIGGAFLDTGWRR